MENQLAGCLPIKWNYAVTIILYLSTHMFYIYLLQNICDKIMGRAWLKRVSWHFAKKWQRLWSFITDIWKGLGLYFVTWC